MSTTIKPKKPKSKCEWCGGRIRGRAVRVLTGRDDGCTKIRVCKTCGSLCDRCPQHGIFIDRECPGPGCVAEQLDAAFMTHVRAFTASRKKEQTP